MLWVFKIKIAFWMNKKRECLPEGPFYNHSFGQIKVFLTNIYLFAPGGKNNFIFESHSPHKIELLYLLHLVHCPLGYSLVTTNCLHALAEVQTAPGQFGLLHWSLLPTWVLRQWLHSLFQLHFPGKSRESYPFFSICSSPPLKHFYVSS